MNLLRNALRSNFNLFKVWRYIKRHLSNHALKIIYYSGFFVEKLQDADSFYVKLKNYPEALKEDELRKMAIFLRKANDSNLYGEILKRFVPQMTMSFAHTKFIGTGCGSYNLNAYRKVVFNDNVFFEKVHFNSSNEIVRLNWFYDNIYSSMSNSMKAPELCYSFKGELITIFYFKYVALASLSDKDVGPNVFNFSRELYKLSHLVDIKDKMDNAPMFLKNYTAYFEYERKIEDANKRAFELIGDRFPFKSIENKISSSPSILAHGDIHKGNVFANNYLIDWDTFGIYPIGLDVAYILLFLKQCKITYKELNHILLREYKATILKDEWDDFEFNCLYFYYVFTIHSSIEFGSNETQTDILNRIVELYNKETDSGNVTSSSRANNYEFV